mgnify:CR=1 FL=1
MHYNDSIDPLLIKGVFLYIVVMKNIILTSIALLSFTFSNAQIGEATTGISWERVGKLTNMYKYAELEKTIIDGENTYRLTFQNLEYSEITDLGTIVFTATDEELDYVYNELIKGLTRKTKDPEVSFNIGKGIMTVVRNPGGAKQVRMYYKEPGETMKWHWFSKSQLNKIFGK